MQIAFCMFWEICTDYTIIMCFLTQREEAAIRALEMQQMNLEKRQRQEGRKADLDYSLKLKLKKQVNRVV